MTGPGALPDPDTVLNKRLATRLGRATAGVRKTLSSDQWRRMSWQQRRDYFAKDAPRLPPEDNDITNGGIANTGATNNWRDQTEMGETSRTARVGGQVIGVPSQTNMQAALDAIKKDLARPKRRLARTADEDEDDVGNFGGKRKHRADRDDE
jgi:hypothetical protein